MNVSAMTDDEIDKFELQQYRMRDELQIMLQTCVNNLLLCQQEREWRKRQQQITETNEPLDISPTA